MSGLVRMLVLEMDGDVAAVRINYVRHDGAEHGHGEDGDSDKIWSRVGRHSAIQDQSHLFFGFLEHKAPPFEHQETEGESEDKARQTLESEEDDFPPGVTHVSATESFLAVVLVRKISELYNARELQHRVPTQKNDEPKQMHFKRCTIVGHDADRPTER